MYEHYCQTGNLEEVLITAANALTKFILNESVKYDLTFKQVKEHVVFQLINTEQNKELLQKIPHREFMDMSIVYRWLLDSHNPGNDDGNNRYSSLVTCEIANYIGMTEDQLFVYAAFNTRRIFPPIILPLNDLMPSLLLEQTFPEDVADEIMGTQIVPMIILSNRESYYGATTLLYDEELQEIAQIFGENFYILPSSIHECIAVPAFAVTDPLECAKMVHSINMEELKITERLSNQVYYYDRAKRQLSMATNIDECLV